MSNQSSGDGSRPVGSRMRDSAHPEAFGSAPEPRRRRSVGSRIASILLLLAALLLIGALVWIVMSYTGVAGGDDVKPGTRVTVVIPAGSSSSEIADVLAKAGIVRNENMFRARLKFNGDGSQFRAGTYSMLTGSSYDSIVKVLEKGPAAAPTFDVTVPEGQRVEETAALIDRMRSEAQREGGKVLPAFTGADYLKAARVQRPPASAKAPAGTRKIEGFLFPATYELRQSASAEDFVAKQREAFDDNFAEIDLKKAAAANLTPYEVVTIASLIEREARLEKERALVSAVIWNRLKIGEPLGIDASNQYSVYVPGSKEFWVRELKQSDLEKDSPYNLRKVGGLPPTPIANPGRSSLEAAANPAKVDYRYYVANPDGSGEHFFTASYDEFLAHPFQGG